MDVLKPLLGSSFRSEQAIEALSHLFLGYAGKPLDLLYSRIGGLNGRFFPRGWGNLGIVNLQEDIDLIKQWPPQELKVEWKLIHQGTWDGVPCKLFEGSYRTPCVNRIFDALPPESRAGRVQLLMPAAGLGSSSGEPLFSQPHTTAAVLHLAATGDHGFSRRLRLGGPLLQQGVVQLVHESPYYGARRPPDQRGSKLCAVSDLLALGWATIYESLCLLNWLEEEGVQHRGICGLSMGGVHAAMTAGLYPRPLAITPLLTPRSAAVAYCDGALAPLMAWHALLKERDMADNEVEQVVAAAARPVSLLHEARYVRLQQLEEQIEMVEGSLELWPQQQQSQPCTTAEQIRQVSDANEAVAAVQQAAALAAATEAAAAEQLVAGTSQEHQRVQQQQPPGQLHASLHESCLMSGSNSCEGPVKQEARRRAGTIYVVERLEGTSSSGNLEESSGVHVASTGTRSDIGGTSNSSDGNVDSNTYDGHGRFCSFQGPNHVEQAPCEQQGSASNGGSSWKQDVWRRHGKQQIAANQAATMWSEVLHAKAGAASSSNTPPSDTFRRLRHVLETYTDVTRYPRPMRPDAAVLVAAQHDGYVDIASVKALQAHWPGSELRQVSGGHVSAFLMHQDSFRGALRDSLVRLAEDNGQSVSSTEMS